MVQFSAVAARSASSNARRFMTGSEPGKPRHTGHVAELGGRPNCVLQPQNSFVLVRSCTWTSRPMTMRWVSIIAGVCSRRHILWCDERGDILREATVRGKDRRPDSTTQILLITELIIEILFQGKPELLRLLVRRSEERRVGKESRS